MTSRASQLQHRRIILFDLWQGSKYKKSKKKAAKEREAAEKKAAKEKAEAEKKAAKENIDSKFLDF